MKGTLTMQETIIEKVGQIYNYLNERGEVTTTKMKKDLNLDDNFAAMGLGWLAREDKINFVKRGAHTKISLR
jgi:hypothetical protein